MIAELKNRVELDKNNLTVQECLELVFYEISSNTKILKDGLKKGSELMSKAVQKNTLLMPQLEIQLAYMGTAKIGNHSKNSVVNRNGVCHDVKTY